MKMTERGGAVSICGIEVVQFEKGRRIEMKRDEEMI